ncbi:Anaphase-promoting complex subunit 11 [Cyphellophora attinorum]|uniref:Anaphase-promoting complex subunit 11 n=1 Tax=Cyphellophora attinorum TaxID=1664694 RepID=A0A0N1NYB1_9EURO|nr:Anaphase-promoting complex subunit 11 [Phialophora attinorum]KPI39807.1 Anaphase-promoting complex subunit 11 [Phialophora attinorum]
MKVSLLSTNLIATWSWQLPTPDADDLCGICRVAFDGTCPTCRQPGDPCPLLIGKCQHSFHMHCLIMWVQQESSRGLCPMCRRKFEWRKEENESARRGGMPGGLGGNGVEEGGGGEGEEVVEEVLEVVTIEEEVVDEGEDGAEEGAGGQGAGTGRETRTR